MHGQGRPAQRRAGDFGVRCGLDEVAAHPDEHARLAVAERADGVDGVVSVLARRIEAELRLQPVEELSRRPLPDPHRPVTLHVGVAAHRQQPGTRFADVALGQRQIGEFLDGRHRVVMLGQPHRPAEHRTARLPEQLGALGDLLATQAGHPADEVPVELAQVLGPPLEAQRVPGHELRDRSHPTAAAALPMPGTARGRRSTAIGRCRSARSVPRPIRPARLLRVAEIDQSRLAQRIDRDDLGAALAWRPPVRTASADGWCRDSDRPAPATGRRGRHRG